MVVKTNACQRSLFLTHGKSFIRLKPFLQLLILIKFLALKLIFFVLIQKAILHVVRGVEARDDIQLHL